MTQTISRIPGFAGAEFTLPLGYTDAAGGSHRYGQMRLATALDEIEPLGDPRVKDNEAFLGLLLFSRVVVRLGEYSPVPLEVIAGLYAADFAYLQSLYVELNGLHPGQQAQTPRLYAGPEVPTQLPPAPGPAAMRGTIETVCPQCQAELILDLDAGVPA